VLNDKLPEFDDVQYQCGDVIISTTAVRRHVVGIGRIALM